MQNNPRIIPQTVHDCLFFEFCFEILHSGTKVVVAVGKTWKIWLLSYCDLAVYKDWDYFPQSKMSTVNLYIV